MPPKAPKIKFDFSPSTTFWRAHNARWAAKAAQLVYQDSSAIRQTVKAWGFSRMHYLDRRETQAFVMCDNNLILVAFRGTEPVKLRDWMTDIDLALTPFPCGRGRVHAGFWRALSYVWTDLLEIIRQEQTTGQSLWFTGHSLGGALATLATARLRLEYDKPVNGLYTFGQPRVGDRDFAMYFNQDFKSRAFRYVNNNDVVTRVPTRKMDYSHIGTFLYYTEKGDLHNDMSWWNRFVETVKGELEDFLDPGPDFVKDHDIGAYVKNADKNLGKKMALVDTIVE